MWLSLKIKIRSYLLFTTLVFTTRLVFNFGWIAEIAAKSKPLMLYVPVKGPLINELAQHAIAMNEAMEKGLVYVPSAKCSRYDGCFYDPLIRKIIKVIEYKTKEIGSVPIRPSALYKLCEKYATLDEVNISYKSLEDLENSKPIIDFLMETQKSLGFKLNITYTDVSLCLEKDTCLLDMDKIFGNQVINNPIVRHVNENLMNEFGIITNSISV